MFKRKITPYLLEQIKKNRCVTLLGPRQAGKTTLARTTFPDYDYKSLEDPDTRNRAHSDPRSFLKSLTKNTILDEIQRTPDLISYLQGILDDPHDQRRFILTGSNHLLLSEKISQSLAGRSRLLTILPLQREEIPAAKRTKALDQCLWQGGYPRIYDHNLKANEWLADYYQSYVEKDVRTLINVDDLAVFDRFIRIIASRVGQISNFSSIATDCGISQPTASSWAGVLQASSVLFLLQPHFRNFSKRMIKSPKIYFYDTGLLCYLLRITSPEILNMHPLRGEIFENWVIVETMKSYINSGQEAPLYFWRDQHGHEIDLVIDQGLKLELIEIKSSATFHPDFIKQLDWLNKLQNATGGRIIYGGEESFPFKEYSVQSWNDIPSPTLKGGAR